MRPGAHEKSAALFSWAPDEAHDVCIVIHVPKGKIARPNLKSSQISKTGKTTPTKTMSTSTCMNFLSWFYFLTPMDGLKGILAVFEGKQKGANLQNERGYAHQNWLACISQQPLFAWIFWVDSIF